MQQSLSVVLERNTVLRGDFATEPYEVAWAREARWFIRVLDINGGHPCLNAMTQISPDGLHWCDHEEDGLLTLEQPGMISRPVHNFGGWLRLKGVVAGDNRSTDGVSAKVLIYLVLKS
jgi:hypothetical protein